MARSILEYARAQAGMYIIWKYDFNADSQNGKLQIRSEKERGPLRIAKKRE